MDKQENNEVWNSTSECTRVLHHGSLATPIIQVFSVSLETNMDDDRPYQIYGFIRGTKGTREDTSFHLYNRECEDAETILKHGNLSLIGPEDGIASSIVPESGIFFPFMGINLDICLKDKMRDVEVIKGSVNLDSKIDEEDCFDKLLKVVIYGEYGIAYVYYAIIQFGALGIMEFSFTKLDEVTDIYGSLVAGYGNSKQYCNNDEELKNLKSILLRIPSDRPMHVMIDNPITLSRHVMVVSAYSSMKVEANLWDSFGKIIISDQVEVEVHGVGDRIVYMKSQYACLKIKIRLNNAYVQLYNDKHFVKVRNKAYEDLYIDQRQQTLALDEIKRYYSSTPDVKGYTTLHVSGVTYEALDLVEVFSIRIIGITKDISALCGLVFIDIGAKVYIYERDENSFELLGDDNVVSTEGPYPALDNSEFLMVLKLKDPVQDLDVCYGEFGWNVYNLEQTMYWTNKRLCSVVQGKDGFAAVHYTIFNYAFKAAIEARIIFDNPDDVPVKVCGNIWTQYSGFDYSKGYQKKYYRSRLLNLPHNKSVELKTGSKIPLCKSLVAVPCRSSLFIEADLKFTRQLVDGSTEEVVLGIQEFESNNTNCKFIQGIVYQIQFFVNFSGDR